MASAAVRFVAGTKKSSLGTLYLQCHVKPGASRVREGVTAVTEGAVEMCVAAQAREGEANKAVIKLLSEVLGLPKSDLTITQGLKSRDKTVAVSIVQNPTDIMARVTEQLQKAANGG
ncbi:Putative YggU-like superfamily protein [Colletotrichum destructivum]|uniref:YggU-like superfamily protein n=1 Tax=Colletotrichum destructivum TaxID=34406 RepID=A0AAX4I6B8_9PEZI|nr:Putative YggU-like superfamily protein [Colletotrichum destructivum]